MWSTVKHTRVLHRTYSLELRILEVMRSLQPRGESVRRGRNTEVVNRLHGGSKNCPLMLLFVLKMFPLTFSDV
jgi:hypothetical protein